MKSYAVDTWRQGLWGDECQPPHHGVGKGPVSEYLSIELVSASFRVRLTPD